MLSLLGYCCCVDGASGVPVNFSAKSLHARLETVDSHLDGVLNLRKNSLEVALVTVSSAVEVLVNFLDTPTISAKPELV